MREPAFWWRKAGLASSLLAPAAACYGAIAARRMTRQGARAGVPVLCVGNFTLGGAGKTPAAMMLAKMLQAAGERQRRLELEMFAHGRMRRRLNNAGRGQHQGREVE